MTHHDGWHAATKKRPAAESAAADAAAAIRQLRVARKPSLRKNDAIDGTHTHSKKKRSRLNIFQKNPKWNKMPLCIEKLEEL